MTLSILRLTAAASSILSEQAFLCAAYLLHRQNHMHKDVWHRFRSQNVLHTSCTDRLTYTFNVQHRFGYKLIWLQLWMGSAQVRIGCLGMIQLMWGQGRTAGSLKRHKCCCWGCGLMDHRCSRKGCVHKSSQHEKTTMSVVQCNAKCALLHCQKSFSNETHQGAMQKDDSSISCRVSLLAVVTA